MNRLTMLKIGVCAAVLAVVSPIVIAAESSVFSAKGAYGYMAGNNGSLYLSVYASEQTTSSKSDKTATSGISVSGSFYSGSECWFTFGSSNAVQFNITNGPIVPKQVLASGTVSVVWTEYCSIFTTLADTITVQMNLTALTDQAYASSGTTHVQYGPFKQNYHFDNSYAPANLDASFINSQSFGALSPFYGEVGQSKTHNVSIIRQ